MMHRIMLIAFVLTLLYACDLTALETIRGVVREAADFQCSVGCGTYYIEPDSPFVMTMLGGDFRQYLGEHVQITGFRDICSGCIVLFPSGPVIVLPPLSVVDEGPGAIPREVRLRQNYPNPFNPATTIEYALVNSSHVRLTVSNLLGQELALLVDAEEPPGVYREVWLPGDRAGGIYICRLQVTHDDQRKVMTAKMLYVR